MGSDTDTDTDTDAESDIQTTDLELKYSDADIIDLHLADEHGRGTTNLHVEWNGDPIYEPHRTTHVYRHPHRHHQEDSL
jgi:hypothetical protein